MCIKIVISAWHRQNHCYNTHKLYLWTVQSVPQSFHKKAHVQDDRELEDSVQSVTSQVTFQYMEIHRYTTLGCAACCHVGVASVYAAFRDLSMLE